jgi:signal transduction histidine kinase
MQTAIQANSGEGYILAIEDSMVQAKKLEYIFLKNNIAFEICVNANDALIQIEKHQPIIIVSDIIMPGMNGYELCKILKNNPATKRIPVILLTSLQDPHDIIKGLQAGADSFISKPYEEQFLISRINHLLENCKNAVELPDDGAVNLLFDNVNYEINSDKKQVINLLLSVYESAILRNNELVAIKTKLEETNLTLEQANEDLAAFAHTVSHDLKNPLNAIMGFSELLIQNKRCQCCKEEFSYMDIVNKSSKSMLNLINDLLNFAKSGITEIERTKIDLSKIALNVVEDIKLRNPEYNMKVQIANDLYAEADPKLMQIVFDNLLGNACKYSQKSNNPTITVGKTEQFGQEVIFVKDNGAGFDMAKADKLFQPFQRLHSNAEFKGTGVGLSTVKKIIERHDGRIWAESEVGVGSVFYFKIN